MTDIINRLTAAIDEIERLRAKIEQIVVVCTDNMDRSCEHRMALDFVRQIANGTDEQKANTGVCVATAYGEPWCKNICQNPRDCTASVKP